jgi:hypothetical protein
MRAARLGGLAPALVLALALAPLRAGPAAAEDLEVDLELVLAVDVSRSMDIFEAQLQREGYAQALEHPTILDAIQKYGVHGKVAIVYVEWAGTQHQIVVAPWTVVSDAESAAGLAATVRAAPFVQEYRTSISQALSFSARLFDDNGIIGIRRVIDVSGDGANNMGEQVLVARARVLETGITINGLPIMTNRPDPFGWVSIRNLDLYYTDCVIGGPGAFIVPISDRSEFVEAIRRKLLLEIAGLTPIERSLVRPAAGTDIDCLIGERQWRRYRLNDDF